MRLFQIGVRASQIAATLKRGGTIDSEERAALAAELAELAEERDMLDPERAVAIKANTEALNALKDEIKKQDAFARQVTSVSLDQAQRAIADMINGQIIKAGYRGRTVPPPRLTRWQRLSRWFRVHVGWATAGRQRRSA